MINTPSLITVDGNCIENVQKFTYLGHVFDNQCVTSSMEHRTARASAKFNQLREVLCDTKVNKKTRWRILEACVVPRLLYGLQACYPKEDQLKKMESCWFQCLRSMVKGGWKRVSDDPEEPDFRFVYRNQDLQRILGAKSIRDILLVHQLRYLGHICREENTSLTKRLLFADAHKDNYSDPVKKIAESVGMEKSQLLGMTQDRSEFKAFTSSRLDPLRRR